MADFSVSSVPTCDLGLHGLSLRERQALMTEADWAVLIDRELWAYMTPTERDAARRRHHDAATPPNGSRRDNAGERA